MADRSIQTAARAHLPVVLWSKWTGGRIHPGPPKPSEGLTARLRILLEAVPYPHKRAGEVPRSARRERRRSRPARQPSTREAWRTWSPKPRLSSRSSSLTRPVPTSSLRTDLPFEKIAWLTNRRSQRKAAPDEGLFEPWQRLGKLARSACSPPPPISSPGRRSWAAFVSLDTHSARFSRDLSRPLPDASSARREND